jgi:hypothetical protein
MRKSSLIILTSIVMSSAAHAQLLINGEFNVRQFSNNAFISDDLPSPNFDTTVRRVAEQTGSELYYLDGSTLTNDGWQTTESNNAAPVFEIFDADVNPGWQPGIFTTIPGLNGAVEAQVLVSTGLHIEGTPNDFATGNSLYQTFLVPSGGTSDYSLQFVYGQERGAIGDNLFEFRVYEGGYDPSPSSFTYQSGVFALTGAQSVWDLNNNPDWLAYASVPITMSEGTIYTLEFLDRRSAGGDPQWHLDGVDFIPVPIPEPSISLLSLAAAFFTIQLRRRRQA